MGFFLLLCLITAGFLLTLGVMAVRAVFWLVLLPFRLVFGLLLFPLWIARAAFKLIGFVVLLPILALAGGIAVLGLLAATVLAVLVPLAPVLLVAGLAYLVLRGFSRRPVAVQVR
jgi:hypothetical protein